MQCSFVAGGGGLGVNSCRFVDNNKVFVPKKDVLLQQAKRGERLFILMQLYLLAVLHQQPAFAYAPSIKVHPAKVNYLANSCT